MVNQFRTKEVVHQISFQEDLWKVADVFDLASQLDQAASVLSLPAEDLAEAFPDPPKE